MCRHLDAKERHCVARQRQRISAPVGFIEDIIKSELRALGVAIHGVTARCKSPESLREKLRQRRYKDPENDITDLIGVRIITYYSTDVDAIAAHLRKALDIDSARSLDKRPDDGSSQFGYRSVHLIARLKQDRARHAENSALGRSWFEIQVRTILEHAWAEIEHEIVYKGGVKYCSGEGRRFAAIAGALELLDREFLALRGVRDSLTDEYARNYLANRDQSEAFDSARMIAFFEVLRPEAKGWRAKNGPAAALPAHSEVTCLAALRVVGLDNARELKRVIRSSDCRRLMADYSSAIGVGPRELSHLALATIAMLTADKAVLEDEFPELLDSDEIRSLLDETSRRSTGRRNRKANR